MIQSLMKAVVESWRERNTIAIELGSVAWQAMCDENGEHWNTARLVAVLRRRVG